MMVIVSILPNAEFGPNDHREGALHFRNELSNSYLDTIISNYLKLTRLSIRALYPRVKIWFKMCMIQYHMLGMHRKFTFGPEYSLEFGPKVHI